MREPIYTASPHQHLTVYPVELYQKFDDFHDSYNPIWDFQNWMIDGDHYIIVADGHRCIYCCYVWFWIASAHAGCVFNYRR